MLCGRDTVGYKQRARPDILESGSGDAQCVQNGALTAESSSKQNVLQCRCSTKGCAPAEKQGLRMHTERDVDGDRVSHGGPTGEAALLRRLQLVLPGGRVRVALLGPGLSGICSGFCVGFQVCLSSESSCAPCSFCACRVHHPCLVPSACRLKPALLCFGAFLRRVHLEVSQEG